MVTGVGDLVLNKESYPTLTRLSYSLEKQSGVLITDIYNRKISYIDKSVHHLNILRPFGFSI